MHEVIANLHVHTTYSDGSKNHQEIIQDALNSHIDVLFFVDHNVFVRNVEGYYSNGKNKKVMVIMGEEVHDLNAIPQKNHMLVLGAKDSCALNGDDPKKLVENALSMGGLTFIAHPYDPALPFFNEPDIS